MLSLRLLCDKRLIKAVNLVLIVGADQSCVVSNHLSNDDAKITTVAAAQCFAAGMMFGFILAILCIKKWTSYDWRNAAESITEMSRADEPWELVKEVSRPEVSSKS